MITVASRGSETGIGKGRASGSADLGEGGAGETEAAFDLVVGDGDVVGCGGPGDGDA